MATLTNAQKRIARIQTLAAELHEKSGSLEDEKVRARCTSIALEIAGLLHVENAHQSATSMAHVHSYASTARSRRDESG